MITHGANIVEVAIGRSRSRSASEGSVPAATPSATTNPQAITTEKDPASPSNSSVLQHISPTNPGRRARSVGSSDPEAELGGHSFGLLRYGVQRAFG